MTTYECSKCDKVFRDRNDFQRHLNRKYSCDNKVEQTKFTCITCGAIFKRKFNLNKHVEKFCDRQQETKKTVKEVIASEYANILSQLMVGINTLTPMDYDSKAHKIINNMDKMKNQESDEIVGVNDKTDNQEPHEISGININNADKIENKLDCAKSCVNIDNKVSSSDVVFNEELKALDLEGSEISSKIPDKKRECLYCKKGISYRNFSKHKKTCKIREEIETKRKEIHEQMLKQKDKKLNDQGKMIEQLKQQAGNVTNTINNNNHGTINNVDLKLVSLGEEKTDHITNEKFKFFIERGFKSVPKLIEYMYFDPKHPENSNTYISNMRDMFVISFEKKKRRWDLKDKEETIDDMYVKARDLLSEKYEEIKHEISDANKRKFERFMNDQKDPEVVRGIKEEIKMILYNNRAIPEAIRRKMNEPKRLK